MATKITTTDTKTGEQTVEIVAKLRKARAPRTELTKARHAVTGAAKRLAKAEALVETIKAEQVVLKAHADKVEAEHAQKVADEAAAKAATLQKVVDGE